MRHTPQAKVEDIVKTEKGESSNQCLLSHLHQLLCKLGMIVGLTTTPAPKGTGRRILEGPAEIYSGQYVSNEAMVESLNSA